MTLSRARFQVCVPRAASSRASSWLEDSARATTCTAASSLTLPAPPLPLTVSDQPMRPPTLRRRRVPLRSCSRFTHGLRWCEVRCSEGWRVTWSSHASRECTTERRTPPFMTRRNIRSARDTGPRYGSDGWSRIVCNGTLPRYVLPQRDFCTL